MKTLLIVFLLLASGPARGETLAPPQVLANPAAMYPTGHTEAATVALKVLVGVKGEVKEVSVVESGGADFDRAAQIAVLGWRFSPALRDGVPFEARIKIPFAFEPPPPPPDGGDEVDGGASVEIAADAGPEATPGPISDAGLPPGIVVVAVPTADVEVDAGPEVPTEEVSVRGVRKRVEHGGSDFEIETKQLAQNVQNSKGASAILQLAPGIFIANEGGQGHADQVFLRGFNAEQGQSIEFTVGGVPINDVDNPDGHGYADTHFIIPELIQNLRVIEGPFDPHQGDFAAAGSASFDLGVAERGLRLSVWDGSFGTKRLLALWAPAEARTGTFAAVQFWDSNGFGTNRANSNASAMAQYEGELGQRGLWRVLATSYATHYKDAGVIRLDDFQSGRVDFYGSVDPSLGGDAQRHSLSFDLQNPVGKGVVSQQLFLTYRTDRIQENFTGFELDQQLRGQSEHAQRGDGIQQSYTALTAGARGGYQLTVPVLGRDHSIEVGYYGRYDHTLPVVQRVRYGTNIPYRVDEDHVTDTFNIAGYADLDLHPFKWLTLRGGVREEFFSYDSLENCATNDYFPSTGNGPLNVQCPELDRAGPRLTTQRTTATGSITEPKVTVQVQPIAQLTFTGSYGVGAQSVGPEGLEQNENAPFATIKAGEGGALYKQHFEKFELSGRVVGFYTHVDRDLIFNPSLGRLSSASGTTRRGGVLSMRATAGFVDELLSATYAYATYDDDHTLVPYVPSLVARSDTAVFGALPWVRLFDRPITGHAGLGIEIVGPRALPLGQTATSTAVADVNASLRWSALELGLKVDNVLDTKYPLSTFFYASDFHTRPYPTLTPAQQFTAGAPRFILGTLTVYLGGEDGP